MRFVYLWIFKFLTSTLQNQPGATKLNMKRHERKLRWFLNTTFLCEGKIAVLKNGCFIEFVNKMQKYLSLEIIQNHTYTKKKQKQNNLWKKQEVHSDHNSPYFTS
jgi:hypothetical protein